MIESNLIAIGVEMRDLILEALRESVKRYPDLFEHIDGAAAWVVIRDDLLLWRDKAIEQVKAGESAVCDFDSDVIPESIAETVKDMLGYCNTENLVIDAFKDIEVFMKSVDSKARHKKIPPYTGEKPFLPLEYKELTEAEINRALNVWDSMMPDYKGILDADIEDDDAR